MKKKYALGGIEMLLALLIITLLFLFFSGNLFKSNKENTNETNPSKVNTHVTQNDVNKKIDEIQTQRNELQEEEQRRLRNLNNY